MKYIVILININLKKSNLLEDNITEGIYIRDDEKTKLLNKNFDN
jgi:hypothetical protein